MPLIRRAWLSSIIVGAVLAGRAAWAHDGPAELESAPEISARWELDPGSVLLIGVTGFLYAAGVARLWRRLGPGRGISWRRVACFACGWLATAVALISPLHTWGNSLFAAHMVQHEILMLVAAPLLVLGHPIPASVWALPRAWRLATGRLLRAKSLLSILGFFAQPLVAWFLHAVALWAWHIPALFEATLASDFAHALQHASFLGTALIFWFALFQGHGRRAANGAGVLYLFTTAVHTGVLGALLTFAPAPWYPAYADTAPLWGLSALEDQQLGGLIMWIPGGVVYIVTGLVLFADWLREAAGRSADEAAAASSLS